MQETKQTLYELIIGVVLCGILFLTGNIFVSNRIAYTLGILLGCIIAGVMSAHMHHSLEQAMLYDAENATKKMQKGTFLRLLLMVAALAAALLLPQWISVIGVALGVLSLKFSAYLQPLTHKVLQNFINKGR